MPIAPVFVDTNILIYASRSNAREHKSSMTALSRMRHDGVPLWLSRQILREYLAAATRPQISGPALPMASAIVDVQSLQTAFNIAEDSPAVFSRLLALLGTNTGSGKQVHDANLVATMLVHRITRLLTANGADFRRFESLIEVTSP